MTLLPYESSLNTALSARWNAALDKFQNGLDRDIRMGNHLVEGKTVGALRVATEYGSRHAGTGGDPYPTADIQTAIDVGPGTVLVPPFVWSGAAVSVKNGVLLIIPKGATGVTFTPAAGAEAMVEDYQNGLVRYYVAGTLKTEINYKDNTSTLSAGGGGDNVSVNGVAVTNADMDDATPAAPSDGVNVRWQKDALDPTNISANVKDASATQRGVVQLTGQLGGIAASPDVRGVRETGGPTLLTLGAVADGEFLKRSGSTVVGQAGGVVGDSVSVNGAAATDADLDDVTPAAPGDGVNVRWQKDASTPSNISANVPEATAGVRGVVRLTGQLGGTAASPDVRGLRETTGPTLLVMGAVADGQFLKRSGAGIVGDAGGGGHTIQDEGVSQIQRALLDFVGTGVTVTDTGSKTQVSIPSGGAAGYYGQRAADFITSGAGTDASPYNLSAIESAINALPVQGGIVFIKAGVYRGPRILLGRTGEAGRAKSIILQGESADLSGLNWEWDPAFNNYPAAGQLVGTLLDGGFRINTYGCQIQFKNIFLVGPQAGGNTLDFEGKFDDQALVNTNSLPIGGFRIQDCKFAKGATAIRITGLNAGASGHQNWNVLIERCHFRGMAQAIRIDDDGGTAFNSIFRGSIKHIIIQAVGDGGTDPVVDVDIANLKGHWYDWLIEDAGASGAGAYCVRIKCGRSEGFTFSDVDFGDNIRSTKNALFVNDITGSLTIRQWSYRKDVDLQGRIDFEGGQTQQFIPAGNVNVLSAQNIILREMPGLPLTLGTIANPDKVLIFRRPGSAAGHLGSSAAGASPFTYTNNDSYLEYVYLVGGTVTGVTRSAQSLGPQLTHLLAPGDSIVISHTAAPTIRRYGVS